MIWVSAVLACAVSLLRAPSVYASVFNSAEDAFGHKCTPEKLAMFPNGWPYELDSHVYWFGKDNAVERATGQPSQFYDPTKKTLIWIDGFNGLYHVGTCARMISKCVPAARCEKGSEFVANPWIERGWNFGIFYWDQFADEDCFYAAERKIWGEQPDGLTWKSYDINTGWTQRNLYEGQETSVAQVCASKIRSAIPTFSGSSLHITGFSLGGQLAAACSHELLQTANHPARPTQNIMLEPVFTARIKPWSARPLHACFPFFTDSPHSLNWTAVAVESMFTKHRVPTAIYKSSWLTRCCRATALAFEPGTQLDILGTLVRWDPNFCANSYDYECQHEVIVPFYFFNWDEPMLENEGPTSGQCKVPSPQCTDSEIYDLVVQRRKELAGGRELLWKQVMGKDSWSLADDVFRWDESGDPPPEAPIPVGPPPRLYDSGSFTVPSRSSSGKILVFAVLFVVGVAVMALCIVRVRRSSRQCQEPVAAGAEYLAARKCHVTVAAGAE